MPDARRSLAGWPFRKALADGDRIEVAGHPVRLRVSGRARRISLRLDAGHGEVVAVAPTARRLADAAAFAHEQAAWIAQRMARAPQRMALAPGQVIEVLGEPVRLVHAPGRTAWRAAKDGEPRILSLGGDPDRFAAAVVRALKAEALRVLGERTAFHAQALGKPLPQVAVADPKARWGSCRPPRTAGFGAAAEVGRIRYSWRLVLAPFAVADYVAAHECAHLIEANHSPRFWAVVAGRVGDHKPHRAWLKAHGERLHAFGG